MMRVYSVEECPQGSDLWRSVRLGIPTASRFSDVLAKGQGITRRKYLYQLAGEILTGEPADTYSNAHMERGQAQEPEARKLYQFTNGGDIQQVGFIRRGNAGASPDSLVNDDGMLEVKTRLAHLQVECLLSDKPPSENIAQAQGQLWIAERAWVDLTSYCPSLPLAVWRIHRDEAYIANLAEEVERFNAELSALVERIRNLG